MSTDLREQRDFLMRSLDDLEAERAAGNIDPESYERLHSDYTARAAAVVRALRDGVDATPRAPRASTRRRVLTIGGIVAFGVVAGVALAAALGARLPGQTPTGNTGGGNATVSTKQREATLRHAVTLNPNDTQVRLDLARFYLSEKKYAPALEQFDAVTRLDPSNAEAHAYGGWIVYLAGQADEALPRIQAALQVDPNYLDAHFFKGVVLFEGKHDPRAAIPELQQYLAGSPGSPIDDQVRQLLAQAVKDADTSSTTTGPPTPER